MRVQKSISAQGAMPLQDPLSAQGAMPLQDPLSAQGAMPLQDPLSAQGTLRLRKSMPVIITLAVILILVLLPSDYNPFSGRIPPAYPSGCCP